MKIGIITIHKSPNYGGSLQTYALFKYISSLGYDCEVIDLYRPSICGYKNSIAYPRLLELKKTKASILTKIRTFIENHKTRTFKNKYSSQLIYKDTRFEDFWNLVKYSRPFFSIDELYLDPPSYDVYITGSDQIWNPTMRYSIEPYFLTFVSGNKKKVSYASSIGLSVIPHHLEEKFKKWLEPYDAIGVREKQAKNIINHLLPNKDVEVVCDPTLLLSTNEWESMTIKTPIDNYVLCFTLSFNNDLYNYAHIIAKERGKTLVVFSHGYKEENLKTAYKVYNAGPCEWMGWIKYSDVVITDSFHATLFSLHFRKPFLTYIAPTNKRGSRITEMLCRIGLSDHLVYNLAERRFPDVENYDDVWNALDVFIESSKKYVKKILSSNG